MFRKCASDVGIDISGASDEEIKASFWRVDKWIKEFQVRTGVDIHWGSEPEDWVEADRILLTELGCHDLKDEEIIWFERRWKAVVNSHETEVLHEEASDTLEELHSRGYQIGICTRRTDSPRHLLKDWRIAHLISTVHWSGVVGYAKPSPYTLLAAAGDLGLNPRHCVFVGNYVDADVDAALRAEMIPVLLTWANPEEKQRAPPEAIILGTPAEVLHLLP